MAVGGFGIMPGQFEALTGLTIDQKNNRVFTSEQLFGRVQMFRYFTNAEAKAELERQQDELEKKAEEQRRKTRPTGEAPTSTDAPAKSGMKLASEPPAVTPVPAETPAQERHEASGSTGRGAGCGCEIEVRRHS